MAGFIKGDVIRVSDWPATTGRRFVVEKVVEVPTSEFPVQVYCREIERGRRVSVFRAFPADRCHLDRKATKQIGLLVGAVLVIVSILAIAYPAVAQAVPLEAAKSPCSMDWRRGTSHRISLIRCAVRHYGPVPGGWRKAVRVARCESYPALLPRTRNGEHVGIYQLSATYYGRWYRMFGKPLGLGRSRYNARTNIIVAIRMANAWGWSAWSCA